MKCVSPHAPAHALPKDSKAGRGQPAHAPMAGLQGHGERLGPSREHRRPHQSIGPLCGAGAGVQKKEWMQSWALPGGPGTACVPGGLGASRITHPVYLFDPHEGTAMAKIKVLFQTVRPGKASQRDPSCTHGHRNGTQGKGGARAQGKGAGRPPKEALPGTWAGRREDEDLQEKVLTVTLEGLF